jgi:hypothetical protein
MRELGLFGGGFLRRGALVLRDGRHGDQRKAEREGTQAGTGNGDS